MRLTWRPRFDLHHVHWNRTWWAKLRDTLQGGVQQQVTLFGMMFSLAIVLIGIAAFLSGNNLIFLLLASMLATMLVSGLISRLSISGLGVEFLLPEHISARRAVHGRISVTNEKVWMPTFSIQLTKLESDGGSGARRTVLYFPCIPGGSRIESSVELTFPKRGTQQSNRFLFSSRFPFGFTERRIEVPVLHEILIYPCLDPQPGFEQLLRDVAGEIESRVRGQGTDFHQLRPYVNGESSRYVDWKASARTGKMQVREFHRDSDRKVDLYLDLNTTDEAWFEQAVDCSAYLVWNLTGMGASVRFRSQDFEYTTPLSGDVYGILKYLATVTTHPTAPPSFSHDRDRYQILFSASSPDAEADVPGTVRRVGPGAIGHRAAEHEPSHSQ
ncbi:hypothetical protein F183_A45190 [Bryobacterales bacterium F-183]|nr:hypothetical protein F183_A45190 [Bryobacterales bacterium F-183]